MPSNRPVGFGRSHASSASGRLGSTRNRLALAGLLGVGSTLLLASCGGETQVPVYPVTGKVTFGSEVPAGANIVLHPQGPSPPQAIVPTGTVGSDGTFTIGTYDRADGAPAGEYTATIQWFRIVGGPHGSSRGPNVLPREYADAASSPIRISVKPAKNELPPIDIRRN